jgi:hypothetical protein
MDRLLQEVLGRFLVDYGQMEYLAEKQNVVYTILDVRGPCDAMPELGREIWGGSLTTGTTTNGLLPGPC